jgi:hypothetical protein
MEMGNFHALAVTETDVVKERNNKSRNELFAYGEITARTIYDTRGNSSREDESLRLQGLNCKAFIPLFRQRPRDILFLVSIYICHSWAIWVEIHENE